MRHYRAAPIRKHNALASYGWEFCGHIDMLCNKLSQTFFNRSSGERPVFFDGSSDERPEDETSDENSLPSLPVFSSSVSSWSQEEQLYHKPVGESQPKPSLDTLSTYADYSETIQEIPQRGPRRRRVSRPHIARPMDFLRPTTPEQDWDEEPLCDVALGEVEEMESESVPLDVLLQSHDSYKAPSNENNDSIAIDLDKVASCSSSSSSSEGEPPSQLSQHYIEEIFHEASHQEILNRISGSRLRPDDRLELIGRFIAKLQQELYRQFPADTRYCIEKIWTPETVNHMLYTQGVPHVCEVMKDMMARAPLIPMYQKVNHSGENTLPGHKYNPVTKPSLYSNSLPGEGIAKAYFRGRTGGYTRWKGTHLYRSSSLRRNSDGEEEIVDNNNEEDVLKRQEFEATRASLELYPPHEQDKVPELLRDTLNKQKTASDDALTYWANVLRPFGFDENFQSKVCSAPYEEQPEDVQQLLVECVL